MNGFERNVKLRVTSSYCQAKKKHYIFSVSNVLECHHKYRSSLFLVEIAAGDWVRARDGERVVVDIKEWKFWIEHTLVVVASREHTSPHFITPSSTTIIH